MHFVIIDHKANRVLGLANANTVEAAAEMVDQAQGRTGRTYVMQGGNTAGRHPVGTIEYWLHDVSNDLVLDALDTPGLVDTMRQMPLKAVVLVTEAEPIETAAAEEPHVDEPAPAARLDENNPPPHDTENHDT